MCRTSVQKVTEGDEDKMDLWMDVLMDAAMDSVRMLPFLFAAFCLLEAMEKHAGNFSQRVLTGIRGAGPLLGAMLGCVPQCGFSVLAANLFSGGMISAGTLLAVFLSTSDEAILMIMGQPKSAGVVGKLLLTKVLIAVVAGYLVDLCFPKLFAGKKEIHDLCKKDSCGCEHSHGVLLPAWNHTIRLFVYILIFSACLNLILEVAGLGKVESLFWSGSMLQPILTALIGFIPNCAASVLLTELYLQGVISFAAAVAGLCTSAGVGLVVLWRVNQDKKENLKLMGVLYAVAVVSGIVLYWIR